MQNHFYPVNWPALAAEIKELNHWRCTACNKQCRRPGELRLGWEYELTVAHYDHVYDVPEVFVTCLCVPCHLRHDAPFVWWHRHMRQRARSHYAGQLSLFMA